MAGATLRAVLGQPTTLLVVQYRHALRERARIRRHGRDGRNAAIPPDYLRAIPIVIDFQPGGHSVHGPAQATRCRAAVTQP
jgi:hypothetical protein